MPYKDPEDEREYQRRYREANREKQREYQRRWREVNRGVRREQGREYYARNRERIRQGYDPVRGRSSKIRRNHGLWPEKWVALYDAQHGRCYLCGEEMTPGDAVVDHDHSCCPKDHSCRVCRRGLAHDRCNVAIGHVYDDPAKLHRMADALEAAQLEVERRKVSATGQLALEVFT